ncbi:hypothetical protein FE257_006604 [Aspergillus nanangensis]|uniref:Uncharacterized protein n=1 Tax=Aspergillus nanangensis TaxID=2582783 RepID=A0AAD4CXW0_ASPNN|nr:hypothetical protein FE257_006604 [Aspergillus nanangensis]
MPVGSMDALGAFSHLFDNVPLWQTRLSELSAYTATKHAEYAEEFRKHSTVRPRRRKNSSVCSIRTDDLFASIQDFQDKSTNPTTVDGSVNPASNPRKRGTDQAPSIDSGERHAFVSTRHNVIIHYDGHTQKSLEEMVRNISTARNNIRRGKMAQLPLAGFRTGMYSRGGRMNNLSAALQADDAAPDQLLSNIRSARNRGPPPPPQQTQPTPASVSPLDTADKHLEIAHGLCETAAYHFLRVGDCSNELSGVQENFKSLLEMATNEVERLKPQQKEESDAEEEETTIKPGPSDSQPAISHNRAIEVDDDAASLESLDLTAFRANRRRAYG